MAVKVMLAPALSRREGKAEEKSRTSPPKAKRRRSSVYDAHGNEVFITLVCLKCDKIKPLAQFGLRKMTDGAIRNQPWCRSCRSNASLNARRTQEGVEEEAVSHDSAVCGDSPQSDPSRKVADSGSIAAEVAAALQAGRR